VGLFGFDMYQLSLVLPVILRIEPDDTCHLDDEFYSKLSNSTPYDATYSSG
jgi:hypothetical protein